MQEDQCPLTETYFKENTDLACDEFLNGATSQGLHTLIVRYEEGLRRMLRTYQ